jgi:hypothetical protein
VEGVAQVPLDRPVGEQPGRAVDLHRLARGVQRVLDVDQLGVDELGVALLSLVEQVGRVVGGQQRGHQPGLHLAELELDGLHLGQRLALA